VIRCGVWLDCRTPRASALTALCRFVGIRGRRANPPCDEEVPTRRRRRRDGRFVPSSSPIAERPRCPCPHVPRRRNPGDGPCPSRGTHADPGWVGSNRSATLARDARDTGVVPRTPRGPRDRTRPRARGRRRFGGRPHGQERADSDPPHVPRCLVSVPPPGVSPRLGGTLVAPSGVRRDQLRGQRIGSSDPARRNTAGLSRAQWSGCLGVPYAGPRTESSPIPLRREARVPERN